jgi:hypothetical protein
VAEAVGGVLAAVVALADPVLIVVGGPWGSHVLDAVAAAFGRLPRHVAVRAADVTTEPSLAGARSAAVSRLRADVAATR